MKLFTIISNNRMKHLIFVTLFFSLFLSCNRNQNVPNDTTNPAKDSTWESFEDRVFPSPKEDTAYSIPNYVCSTDWMKRYVQFIEKNYDEEEDNLWTRKTGDEHFDCRYWSLAYVDDDTIPEMLLYGGCRLSESIILTQYNGKVYESPKGGFMFIEGGKGLLQSQWSQNDETGGKVYKMCNGRFVEIINYCCFSDYYDTTEIDKYGLDKEDMTNWMRGNGTVGISGIKINDKVVDVNYGYRNWYENRLKPILDLLYYAKGDNIGFPKPLEKKTIEELFTNTYKINQ